MSGPDWTVKNARSSMVRCLTSDCVLAANNKVEISNAARIVDESHFYCAFGQQQQERQKQRQREQQRRL